MSPDTIDSKENTRYIEFGKKVAVHKCCSYILYEGWDRSGYACSPIFHIALDHENDTSWVVVLYRDEDGSIAGYLQSVKEIKNPLYISYTVSADNSYIFETGNVVVDYIECFGHFWNSEWFIIEDKCYVNQLNALKIEIKIVAEDRDSYETTEIQHVMIRKYETLFETEEFDDVAFLCSDGKEITANKEILLFASPVFSNMIEYATNYNINTIQVHDVDSILFMEVIRFIYTGAVYKLDELAPKLINCAVKFQLPALKKLCVDSMIRTTSYDNIFSYIELAEKYQELILDKRCLFFIKSNYEVIRNQDEWKSLKSKIIGTIDSLLQKNVTENECICSEEFEEVDNVPSYYRTYDESP